MKSKILTVNRILWAVYIALLGVLLPHTAWAFQQFEPKTDDGGISWIAWIAAFAFEAAIASLTHKLAKQIESTPKRRKGWAKFSFRYLNAYSLGLVVAVGVSSLANLAHAVEFGVTFGSDLQIFTEWGIPFSVYAFAFGAILPLTSLVFARVLSNVVESEAEDDPELSKAKNTIAELRKELNQARKERDEAKQRFEAVGDMAIRLFSSEKKEIIMAASQLWPSLSGTAIAVIAGSSPSHVSETLKGLPVKSETVLES